MNFTCSVDIDLPLEETVSLWQNPDNLVYWQDGYLGMEHLAGPPGEEGSTSRMSYSINGVGIELTETIMVNKLPHEFSALYISDKTENTMENYFESLSESKTRWISKVNYTELKGWNLKILAKLFPGMFKKQVQKWLNQFKQFAES